MTGTIHPAEQVTAVAAIDRDGGQKYQGSFDASTGRFMIAGLPPGRTVDCLIDYAVDGRAARLEGVNMRVPPSDYEEEQPLSDEDRTVIREKLARLNKFEDEIEVLALEGNIQHAAVLMTKLRTRPFFGSKPGEVVWRMELWHFERPDETWVKVTDELFVVLYRERLPRSEFNRKCLTLDPALGGLVLGDTALGGTGFGKTGSGEDQAVVDVGEIQLSPVEAGIRLMKENTP